MNVEVAVDASVSGSGGNQGIFYPFDPQQVISPYMYNITPESKSRVARIK